MTIITFNVLFLILIALICNAQQWMYSGSNSLCYSEGKAFRCVPPFSNIIEGVLPNPLISTCGQSKKQRICTDKLNCHSCMKSTHSMKLLTDLHMNNNLTYWASDYIEPGENVNITYSLKKLFEIYYISLVFIPMLEPDSVIVEKSIDYGNTWSVWHYFSKDCQKSFGLPATDMMNYLTDSKSDATMENDQNIKCGIIMDSKQLDATSSHLVVAFTTSNTNIFSQSTDQHNTWMSATNIKISLQKFPSTYPNPHFDGFTYPPLLKQYFNKVSEIKRNKSLQLENYKMKASPSVLHAYEYFALADIAVGGRCQCYGHASRCLKNPVDNTFYCDCQHNTAGKDCEVCKIGFVDKPWSIATTKSAGECKRCNCNLHSRKCEFNEKLYILSNRQSGGVCEDCQHNTDGRYCHYCKSGHYRDWSKPLSHQHVCIKCRCHPIGSKFPDRCDQRNSQCICKEGVTGLSCNRCQKGYQQTRSPIKPCVESFDVNKMPMAQAPENKCPQCHNKRKRIRFKKYCRKDAVLLVTMQSREQHGDMIRFEMKVNYVWRIDANKFHSMQSDFLASMNAIMANQNSHSTFPLWVKEADLKCNCPSLQLGMIYLILLKLNSMKYLERSEILFDRKSVALNWQKGWLRRMEKFSERERTGFCIKWKQSRQRQHRRNNI